MENIWVSRPIDKNDLDRLKVETKLPSSIIQLLCSIGIHTADEASRFLKPSLKQVHSPFLLTDMEKAVERINRAIENKERILFHGDYDCDGVTTTTFAIRAFQLLGVEIDFFVPNRFRDGYGLNPANMKKFGLQYDLIITGDTGIRAFGGAAVLEQEGLKADLIITDHHEPFVRPLSLLNEAPEDAIIEEHEDSYIALPKAYAVIDPHRLGDQHPCKAHAGVGVIFKTMLAVFRSRNISVEPLLAMLDLVATGTIVDLAPQINRSHETLDFETRVMCKAGIQLMNTSPPIWVQAIMKVMNRDKKITGETLGFTIGPLLNAVGRLEDPTPAVEFLLEENIEDAIKRATILKEINEQRKAETEVAQELIKELSSPEKEERVDYGIVVHSELYGEGIAGLIAEKLKSSFYRPAIALTTAEKNGKTVFKGSARSIPGIHILHMLDEVKREIGHYEYGGHEQAAGMNIAPEQLGPFISAFRKACMKHNEETFVPTFFYESEVEPEEINDSFMSLLSQFEPFGEGNKKPTFRLSNAEIESFKPHSNKRGFNLTLRQNGWQFKAISFNLLDFFFPLYSEAIQSDSPVTIDILFQPSYNEYKGVRSIQLGIQDIKLSTPVNLEA
ncbi:hypothetical protein CN918_26920 [Priestia megaterium]|nr:hypothetical protein CN918_26920 [Priestia megaterium]